MQNHFHYFTEIEEQFQRRRGSILLLSTLDWALIETWKDAGIPLQAVLRGIDATFDTYDRKPSKTRKINGLGYCSQQVLAAAEEMKEAAVGAAQNDPHPPRETGFEAPRIAGFLNLNANLIGRACTLLPEVAAAIAEESATTLRSLAENITGDNKADLEKLEQHLTVMEERLQGALLTAMKDSELLAVRSEADREIAPYRSKMSAAQISHLHKQYVHKRLLEQFNLPRLSLFYMP